MTWRELGRSFRLLFARRAVEREMEEELRYHAEMRARELVASGIDEVTARRRAETEMGGSLRLREEIGDVHGVTFATALEAFAADVRYAARRLRRAPSFAFAAIATFALGIGANATMWSLTDRLLFQPPRLVENPEELVVFQVSFRRGADTGSQPTFSYPAFAGIRTALAGTVPVVAGEYSSRELSMGTGANASIIRAHLVMAGYFDLLGVRPRLGRFFTPTDDDPSQSTNSVVISESAWRRLFGGRSDVIGQAMNVSGLSLSIIGVAPAGFTGLEGRRVDAWIPLAQAPGLRALGDEWLTERRSTWLWVLARAKPGVAPRAIELAGAGYRAAPEPRFESEAFRWQMSARPLTDWMRRGVGTVKKVALLLTGVSVLVLLIACANLSNLFLSREISRERETSVRIALGASRSRLGRQALAESMLLAALGGMLGLLLAMWGGGLVARQLFGDSAWGDAMVDGRLVLVTVVAVIVAGILPAILPMIRRVDPMLAPTARVIGGERTFARSTLVILQAALTVILLAGAGLFVKSLRSVGDLEIGFVPDRVLMATVSRGNVGYNINQRVAAHDVVAERLRALPGVTDVALAITVPSYNSYATSVIVGADTVRPPAGGSYMNANTPTYFAVMGMRILRGRGFTDDDVQGGAPVVVVNETLAEALARRGSILGSCILITRETACRTVVGVTANSRRRDLIEDEIFHVHIPLAQAPGWRGRVIVIRTEPGREEALMRPIQQAIQSAAGGLPWAYIERLADRFAPELRPWRLGATIFGAFGVLALLIAAVGLFGVLSFNVARRRTEIGVRMALGEPQGRVLRNVVGQALRLVCVGSLAGGLIGMLAGRWIEPLLFRTSPRDPAVYAIVLATIAMVGAVAALGPGWRATRVDPGVALRAET